MILDQKEKVSSTWEYYIIKSLKINVQKVSH